MPKVLQPHGGAMMALRPEYGDHFAEGAHAAIAFPASTREQRINKLLEQAFVGPTLNHKLRERFFGIERKILTLHARSRKIHALGPKSKFE